jgi:alpha-1,3-glucosyltransferase
MGTRFAFESLVLCKTLQLMSSPSPSLRHLILLGITTVSAFVILFLPFLYPSFPTHLIPPIQRIFPFARGLFEDKVANFWCASNVFFKWNNYFPKAILPKLATGMTALAFIPSMWALLAPGISNFGCMDESVANNNDSERSSTDQSRHPNKIPAPTFTLFSHALFQCSLSFFLFSFQVHEKTILVPLLPATLIMTTSAPTVEGGDWEWGALLNNVACFRYVLSQR